jgi:uncharacterized membrane protein
MDKILFFFIVFATLGVAHEIFWTSILDFWKTKNLRFIGRSSLLMFPVYGSVSFLFLIPNVYEMPWLTRGLIYMILIYLLEYISGFIFKKIFGVAPWNYEKNTKDGVGSPKKYHFQGLVCLEYAPIWFIEGLIAHWLYFSLINYIILNP